jgi:hypothetical protein
MNYSGGFIVIIKGVIVCHYLPFGSASSYLFFENNQFWEPKFGDGKKPKNGAIFLKMLYKVGAIQGVFSVVF